MVSHKVPSYQILLRLICTICTVVSHFLKLLLAHELKIQPVRWIQK